MADIKQDLLSLQYSQNFDIQGMQEVNVDLELPPASVSLATVYGVVTDGTAPVANATVKLFDSAGLPYQHTMTDAIADGSIANVTMSMVVDSRTYNGTVSGIIRNNAGLAVAGCFVGLYQVVTVAGVSQELLIATTKTNDAGKYLFGGVTGGEYLVKAKLEQ